MYHILLVDDELPALRFLETIITKYTSDFDVTSQQRDGASALSWLREHPGEADVLITDIRMPDMDGITLAKAARNLFPDLHIVIVSGYSEFEYAHGAIEASVDDYILKPVSVSHMKELLNKIRNQLDAAKGDQILWKLTALLNDETADPDFFVSIFGDSKFYFALLRYGNVIYPQKPLQQTALAGIVPFDALPAAENKQNAPGGQPFSIPDGQPGSLMSVDPENIYFLTGRDDKEFLLFAKAGGSVSAFHKAVRQIAETSGYIMATIIIGQAGMEFEKLGTFYTQASKLLRHNAVIGHFHEEFLTVSADHDASDAVHDDADPASRQRSGKPAECTPSAVHIPPTILRRLELCVSENNLKDIHHIFRTLGAEWDGKKVTQRQAYVMMQQLLHLVEAVRLDHWKDTDQVMTEAETLTNHAVSYQELLESLYQVLYDPDHTSLKQKSPEDIYQYAIRTIQKKFNQPISIQTVCSEIGISQTYLSRLFRKYGETSFNSYLVQCRMDNARKMLTEHPDIPLHQVAACVGYDDYAYFSKVFRQVTGISPSQYQSSLKQK